MIRLEAVSRIYKGDTYKIEALKNVSLEIQKGEFVSVVGESGSGKSTLLNMIGCLDSATEGKLYIHGELVSEGNRDQIRRQSISFVFQHFALLPEFSVYENIEIPLLAQNRKRKQRKERIMAVLTQLSMREYADFFPEQLSGGQKQRVAIARALVSDAPILLADEPTGALDKANAIRFMEILKEVHNEGKTIVVVTHSDLVTQYANRHIRLDDGVIQTDSGKGLAIP